MSISPAIKSRPQIVPASYVLLSNWRYVEYSLLRVLAGWGRAAGDWEDKLAVCHHVWLQAEIVERMRRRLDMFPGGKKDGPVHAVFEQLANTVLLAPGLTDAMAGVHRLNDALVQAYCGYLAGSHRVHDRPTHDVLREALMMKQTQADWYDGFRRRHPSSLDQGYLARIDSQLAALAGLAQPIDPGETHAQTCGKNTDFRMDVTPGRPRGWNASPNVEPFLDLDWAHSVDAHRLDFMIGFMREMGVAEEQLRWIYYADFMPFEYVYAESRHMWDESRHGDSGMSRLHDFGLDLADVYYDSYGTHGQGKLPAMAPADLYNRFFFITQIAETGYFPTKRYCLQDFAAGRDEASAEMMQYDIIDETSHAEYGRLWLGKMMELAGVSEDYLARGRRDRAISQELSDSRVAAMRRFSSSGVKPTIALGNGATEAQKSSAITLEQNVAILSDPKARRHYEWLLAEVAGQCPLKNLEQMPVRPNKPL